MNKLKENKLQKMSFQEKNILIKNLLNNLSYEIKLKLLFFNFMISLLPLVFINFSDLGFFSYSSIFISIVSLLYFLKLYFKSAY